jgi:hypothetical protein
MSLSLCELCQCVPDVPCCYLNEARAARWPSCFQNDLLPSVACAMKVSKLTRLPSQKTINLTSQVNGL